MLFPRRALDGIAAGRITLVFRRRVRPPARRGGTLLTAVGQLAVDAVEPIDPAALTDEEARRAGLADCAGLRAFLARGSGPVHRIVIRLAGPDLRVALGAEHALTLADLSALKDRLDRLDHASPRGAWTRRALEAIGAEPGRPAAELAAGIGWDKRAFKDAVRKLKALALTESLAVGYRLSPRGRACLAALEAAE